MGCSISCSLFEKFSTFLDFQVKRMSGSLLVTHYLDDFLFVGPSASSCAGVLRVFSSLCNQLGVPIAKEKTEGPVQTITYLGLEIDAVTCNPFASEAVYTRNLFFDRLSDSV